MTEAPVIPENEAVPAAPQAAPPGVGRRLARFLVRLVLVVLLGVALGVGAYFGVPALYRQYIQPIGLNSQRIAELEQELDQLRQEDRQDREQTTERLTAVEGQLAAQAEELASLQSQLERLQTAVGRDAERLEDLSDLEAQVESLRTDLDATMEDVAELGTDGAVYLGLQRRLELIRAMELITRARLWLAQSNLGLAGEEVRAAYDIVQALAEGAPEDADEILDILERLDMALTGLQTAPVVAADDLDVAWHLLLAATQP